MAEVPAQKGKKPDGAALLRKYHQKCQRHRAFREDFNRVNKEGAAWNVHAPGNGS
ncbi:MAG: hypothetical protein AB1523_11425 [Bacillota bacterium]